VATVSSGGSKCAGLQIQSMPSSKASGKPAPLFAKLVAFTSCMRLLAQSSITCLLLLLVFTVYQELRDSGFEANSTTYNALISAYGKLGQLDRVLEVYKDMVWRGLERRCVQRMARMAGHQHVQLHTGTVWTGSIIQPRSRGEVAAQP
jgi:pentatricopeptide repeat protein